MKKILLIVVAAFAGLPLFATPVATTTVTKTLPGNGGTVTVTEASAATPGYYRMTWMTVTGGERPGNRLKAFVYSTGVTDDVDNMYCATTYAEMAAQAATLNFVGRKIPAQAAGQP